MENSFLKILQGYLLFREKYALDDNSIMQSLAYHGQKPHTMVVSCCDSRVDPALIMQCDPGDLFVVRNVANIIPPFENDGAHHGTSAALEFGLCFLNIQNLILLGHSQCGGIHALLQDDSASQNDFITNWVSLIKTPDINHYAVDDYAKLALNLSYENCLTFPWIQQRVDNKSLKIHLWFFDVKLGQILMYSDTHKTYQPLESILPF